MAGDRRPTVAALIPVWNGAAYLAEAIESVVAERVDEVVVVDDGSTDDSGAIAERFGPPVRCLRQANRGVAAARNAALRASRSDLVAFLDADDVWPRGRLERLLRALDEHPGCGIAQGRLRRMVRSARTGDWEFVDESWRAPNVSTALIRREVFATVGPFDENARGGGDDVDWLLRVREAGVAEVGVDAITLYYRRHDTNMTNDVATDQSRLLRVLARSIARRRAVSAPTPGSPTDGGEGT